MITAARRLQAAYDGRSAARWDADSTREAEWDMAVVVGKVELERALKALDEEAPADVGEAEREAPDMPFAAYAHWQRKALWAEAELGDAARLIGQLLRVANRSDDDRYREASAWLKGYGAWLEDKPPAAANPESAEPAPPRVEG